jgi:hypothetical protein
VTTGDTARWRGHTHEELYKLLHDGPGAAASADPSRRWAELATTLTEVGQDLRKALDLTGAGWSGRAAGSAYDRLSRTARWAEVTGTNAAEMRTAVEDQGDHIAKARADMPVPESAPAVQPDPTVAPAVQVVGAQTDLEAREAARAAGEERAFEVMATYQENTETTTAALATFKKPTPLFESSNVHHNGSSAPTYTSPAHTNWRPPHHEDRRPWWQQDRPWHSPSTSGAGAVHTEAPAARSAAPPPAPGVFSGATTDPLSSAVPVRPGQRRTQARGNATPKGLGPTSGIGTPAGDLQAQAHAAAASQAASAHGAGAPMAGGAGAGAGTQDKLAMRRFGMEAIGSSQWFGDDDEPVVGQSPRRRYDVPEEADITEAVSVMGEEHKLPPTVIGD